MGLFTKSKAVVPPPPPQLGQDGADISPPPQAAAPAIAKPMVPAQPAPLGERAQYMQQLRVRIHQQLVERLDVQNLKTLPADTVRAEVRILIRELCQHVKGLLSSQEQEKLMDDVMDETFGLGPLETLLKDPTISDILVNRHDRVYVERRGRLESADINFRDTAHLRQIIDRIVAQIGRRIDETSP